MNSTNELWSDFENHFEEIVADLSLPPSSSGISWSYQRIKEILEYNVPDGKRTRGLTVVSCYDAISNGQSTKAGRKLALTMGWAVEILQAAFLVADDLMDQSELRRGKNCWYRKNGVGYQAVNDCMVLESCVFTLLRKHFRSLPCYADLVDLFHTVLLRTEMGQSLDMATSEQPEVDFSSFTEEKYSAIIQYKTAYYSFYLPIAVAFYLTGITDEECHKKSCDILVKIGSLFQIQDDYLDVYGDPEITGKIGTDIEDNKCSWLIVKAISIASGEQLKILESCYGKKNGESVKKVKEVFGDLNLVFEFKKYENETYQEIKLEIENFDDTRVPQSVFLSLLNKIYKRKK
ncbi:unnamed protein product [Clavelina lepadiformis]|uniref:Farnesyl pyrophosphate synthase n=1 Tax=Clavelina lepadiformis TaxID=159417 RepID=A0ABP0FG07_CLALP